MIKNQLSIHHLHMKVEFIIYFILWLFILQCNPNSRREKSTQLQYKGNSFPTLNI